MDDGYEFFANRLLVTIFSAPNYCGMFDNDGCLMKVADDLTCSFMILKPQTIPEYKVCWMNSFEIGNPKNQPFLKSQLKQKPVKKELLEGEPVYAEEHQISVKTNKGAQHINLWVKPNPEFDSDDALDTFLKEAQGLVMMFDAPYRYLYHDLPKFMIYALQMFVPSYGDKSETPFLMVGK